MNRDFITGILTGAGCTIRPNLVRELFPRRQREPETLKEIGAAGQGEHLTNTRPTGRVDQLLYDLPTHATPLPSRIDRQSLYFSELGRELS